MMDYCKSIFTFEKKEFKKFENWKVRKDFEKNSKFQKKLVSICGQIKCNVKL